MTGLQLEWWAGVLGGVGLCLIVWWAADRKRRWACGNTARALVACLDVSAGRAALGM